MSNTVLSQGYGPLSRHSSLQACIFCWDASLRYSLAPKSWGRVYIITGRPPGDSISGWANSVSVPEVNNILQFSLNIKKKSGKVRKLVHTVAIPPAGKINAYGPV